MSTTPESEFAEYFAARADVRTWQKRMRARGWRIDIDGEYGPKSAAVALAFQREKHLTPDAIVGPKTWAASWTKLITHRFDSTPAELDRYGD